jgi:hypothetical protein
MLDKNGIIKKLKRSLSVLVSGKSVKLGIVIVIMWKKNPLVHSAIGFSLAILFTVGLLVFITVKADYWADGRVPPILIEGVLEGRPPRQFRNDLTRVNIQSGNLIYALEVSYRTYSQLQQGKTVQALVAPRLTHTYMVKVLPDGPILPESEYKAAEIFQDYQMPVVTLLVFIGIIAVGFYIYGLIGFVDRFLPSQKVRGIVIARIEQGDYSSPDYALLLRRWSVANEKRNWRFYLSEKDFKQAEAAEFAEIIFTPFFHFVRQLNLIKRESLTPAELEIAAQTPTEKIRLLYTTNWRKRVLMFSDGVLALLFFFMMIFLFANSIPAWLNVHNTTDLPEQYYMPALGFLALLLGFYFSNTFIRKLRDLRAPKKITVGPVLSKWRVNGGTNDTRRQIVVVDGGLQAGSEGVRKFDISNFLFEELKVGDIVEIEHTPRLRYIFRLEVKGYQELSQNLLQ